MHKMNARSRRPFVTLAIVLLSLTLVFALAACQRGGGDAQEEAPAPTEQQEAAPADEATEAPEPAEEPSEAPTEEPTEAPTEEPTAEAEEEPTAEPEEEPAPADPLASMDHMPDPMLVDATWEWISRDPNGNDLDEITV